MIAQDIVEKFVEVNFENFTDGRVNGFSVSRPFASVIFEPEHIRNGEVISEHIVEAYRFFESVEYRSFGLCKRFDQSYDLSVDKSGNTETHRSFADSILVYRSRSSVRSDVRFFGNFRAVIEHEKVAERYVSERFFEIVYFVVRFRELVYVEVEYSRKEFLIRRVLIVRSLVFISEAFESEIFAIAHRKRIVYKIAELSVVIILSKPLSVIVYILFNFLERIVGKLGKDISVYAVYRVNLVGFFLAGTGHFAFEAFKGLERLVINRHYDRSDFERHNHIDHALRIGYRNVSSADKKEDIRRRAAVKLTEDSRAFVSVCVVPLARLFIVSVSAYSVGVSKEVADKYGIGDIVADIDYKIS